MDAVEFTKEARRMCLSHTVTCGGCGAWDCNEHVCKVDFYEDQFDPAEAIRIVEEWSKAHPIQTNADKFCEVFGFGPVTYYQGEEIHDYIADPKWWHEQYEAPKGDNNG